MIDVRDGPFALAGLEVGHAQHDTALTGVTVLLFPAGARAACDVRGGAPGTRESAALDPISLVPSIHGLLLTGGSAFGLDAAGGVVRRLEERGLGFATPEALVPIVPAAVIYDLRLSGGARPDAAMAYRAAREAREGPFAEGSVGAGRGATVGKVLGRDGMMRGGVGAAWARAGAYTVGAIAVVNAFGDVVNPETGAIIAGTRAPGGGLAGSVGLLAASAGALPAPGAGPRENTTLVAVVTDAPLSKIALGRVARMAHDGLGRAVRPAHTQWDGDIVYAVALGAPPSIDEGSGFGAVAAEVVARAIPRAVRLAEPHPIAPPARIG